MDRFADRLRAAPQSRLQQGAAQVALDLARDLSARAQRLEGGPVREMPDAGIFVVGDQVAVAGLDLAEALRAADAAGDHRDRDSATAPSEVLDEAVRLVEQADVRAMR